MLAGSPEQSARRLDRTTTKPFGTTGSAGMFGDRLDGIKSQIIAMRKSERLAKVKAYGLDSAKREDLMYAAEEAVGRNGADRAQPLGFVRRAVAIVRQWLRENIPGFDKMKLTDDEIINQYIVSGPGGARAG